MTKQFLKCLKSLKCDGIIQKFAKILFLCYYSLLKKMLKKSEKEKIIKEFGLHKKDTGSVEVQIALLSKQIEKVIGHLKENPKDIDSRRGLLAMVNQRKKFLKYLEEGDFNKFQEVKKKLNLK